MTTNASEIGARLASGAGGVRGGGVGVVRPSNRYGWDYRRAAEMLGKPVVPIIDVHAHVYGEAACRIFDSVRRLFGVERVYTMTQLPMCEGVRQIMGDALRFTAFPTFSDPDRERGHGAGYVEALEQFRTKFDSRMFKIWASPKLREFVPSLNDGRFGATLLAEIDSHWRVEACKKAQELGMMTMVHVADPDSWFAKKYTDVAKFGTKRDQYIGLERMLDRFTNPWIAAHMGGWPEDLAFLDGMLTRHPNLHLDTSATKWVVRELGRQPRAATVAFFTKWSGRILFGSDIVVQEDQTRPTKQGMSPMGELADSPEAAFDLYASRYWALRMMFESDYDDLSPIADGDLKLEDASADAISAPRLVGLGLSEELQRVLYRGAAERVVEAWWKR